MRPKPRSIYIDEVANHIEWLRAGLQIQRKHVSKAGTEESGSRSDTAATKPRMQREYLKIVENCRCGVRTIRAERDCGAMGIHLRTK